ncbi:hypothetical protein BOX15_Mlig000845g2, partial [Macrostomum lignano]
NPCRLAAPTRMASASENIEWQCQHCTFINSSVCDTSNPKSRIICSVCSKSVSCEELLDLHQRQQRAQHLERAPKPKPRKNQQHRQSFDDESRASWSLRDAETDAAAEPLSISMSQRFSRTRMSETSSTLGLRRCIGEERDPGAVEANDIFTRSSKPFYPTHRATEGVLQWDQIRPLRAISIRNSKAAPMETTASKECPVCIDDKKLVEVPLCDCEVCSDCLCQQIEVRLMHDSSVSVLTCPVCDKLDDRALTDTSCEYFPLLQRLLAGQLKPAVMKKLDERLRDWRLKLTDNFCWCSGCSNGFEVSEHHDRQVRCPHCGKETCRKCGKAWHERHRGVSCQQFGEWRQQTDLSERGLAQFLESRGSSCPKCGFQFELSRGGCLHLTCRQCKAEFCSDCGSLFVRQECCGGNKGLHCHHGSECVETFRDWPLEKVRQTDLSERGLAQFLESRGSSCPKCGFQFELSRGGCLHLTCRQCKAEFCSDCGSLFVRQECCGGNKGLHCHHGSECVETFRDWPLEKVRQAALERGVQLELVGVAGAVGRCSVQEQKETSGGGLEDGECGRPVVEAGLCESHLKEALASAMRGNKKKDRVGAPDFLAGPMSSKVGKAQRPTSAPLVAPSKSLNPGLAQRPMRLDFFSSNNKPKLNFNRRDLSPTLSEISTSVDFACPHCTAVSPTAPSVSNGSRVLCTVCGKTTPSKGGSGADGAFSGSDSMFNSYDVDFESCLDIWD